MGGLTRTEPYRLLIGGKWVDGSAGTYDIINPATEEVVGHAPQAGVDEVVAAGAAARDAFESWSATTARERSGLLAATADRLRERAGDLLGLVQAETGATVSVGAALQVPMCTNRFDYYAQAALNQLDIALPPSVMGSTPLAPGGLIGGVVARPPVGVVGCISPYNFPLTNIAGKIAPALAVGNTVVIKPAPQNPLAILELVQIMDEVGFPPGVVNVVTGSGPDVGAAVTQNPDVDMISFTGSTSVGQRIYEAGASNMKRLLMELGGKGAALVFDDADVAGAVTALVSVWAFHAGQICTAPTRAIVQRKVYQQVVDALAVAAGTLTVGDPLNPATVVGPVISAAHRDRIEGFVASGVAEGAELLAGGSRPEHLDRGFYVAPTLLAECQNDMEVVREEIFGPVVVVVPFDDEEEGIALANDSPYGLYDYVFSSDTAWAYRVARRLRAGNVGINTAQRNHAAPFGGFKMSGIGRDGGEFGLHAYTEMQSIVWPG
ncbi:MAG: aldehyde dehydrogenase family protein [Acidimicrobiales bacterium]